MIFLHMKGNPNTIVNAIRRREGKTFNRHKTFLSHILGTIQSKIW